jgi:hypothetical protein
MDPITSSIVAVLSAKAVSEFAEPTRVAVTHAYDQLKDLISKKFGADSEVMQAINQLEARPQSAGRKTTLQEEIAIVNAGQDQELLGVAQLLLTLLKAQQGTSGNINVTRYSTGHKLIMADYNRITQHFIYPSRTQGQNDGKSSQ